MRCERCGVEAKGYSLHDYCALCSKNLCEKCMQDGCCGGSPAMSGIALDQSDDSEGDEDE